MDTLTYVSKNSGKIASVQKYFGQTNIEVAFFEHHFDEPEINDIKMISEKKAMEAYELVKSPCFVTDSGFYIDNFPGNPGYPGAFAKRSGLTDNPNLLLASLEGVEDRGCQIVDCLTFYDGQDFYTFYGINEGTIAHEVRGLDLEGAKSLLWYLFIPKYCDQTLAEMTPQERDHSNPDYMSATKQFAIWYKEVYLKQIKRALK